MRRQEREERPLFFIVGSGRSGTTVFRALLNAHPEVSIAHESDFAIHGYSLSKGGLIEEADYSTLARAFRETSEDDGWGWSEEEVEQIFLKERPNSFQGAVRILSLEYSKKEGVEKGVLGIKRPMLIFYLKDLQEIFPSSPILHLVRDGRDVYLSYREVHNKLKNPFGPKGIVTSALYWSVGLSEMGKRKESEKILELRYEDLLEDSSAVLQRVCEHLNITFSENEMLNYAKSKESENMILEKDKDGHHSNVLKGLMGKNHGKYLNKMKTWELWLFEGLAGNWLRSYGYKTEVPKVIDILFALPRYFLQGVACFFNKARYKRRESALNSSWRKK